MKRAIGLIRVSSEDQKETGYGIPTQAAGIGTYMVMRGYELAKDAGFATEGIEYIPGFFQEDFTGKTALRPAVQALQEAVDQHKIDVVVIHRTNRLGRKSNVQDILEADLIARGVEVEYVNTQFDLSTPSGRFMRRIYSSLDQLEWEMLVKQLRDGRETAARRGSIVLSRPPFGYAIEKVETDTGRIIRRLVIIEEEAAHIMNIFNWYVYGDQDHGPYSMTAIAAKLTALKVLTRWDTSPDRRGVIGGMKKKSHPPGVWDQSTVRKLLMNETYMGLWAWGTTETVPIPGTDKVKQIPRPREEWIFVPVPAIVDEDLWHAAQNRKEENKLLNPRHQKFTYLFAGMLTCGKCHRAYHGTRWSKTAPYRYRCGSKRGTTRYVDIKCDMPNFGEEEIDAVIWPWIREVVSNPEKVAEALDERQREGEEQNAGLLTLVRAADKLLEGLRADQKKILTLYMKDKLSEDRWEAEDKALTRQIADQEAQKAKLLGQVTKPIYSSELMDDIKEACQWIAEGLNGFTREDKREVYELLALRATIALESEEYVLHCECILDARRLAIKRRNGSGGQGKSAEPSIQNAFTGRSNKNTGGAIRFQVRLVLRRAA